MVLLMNAKLQRGPEGIYQVNVFGTNAHIYDTFASFSLYLYCFLYIYMYLSRVLYSDTIHAVHSWNRRAKEKKKNKERPFSILYTIYTMGDRSVKIRRLEKFPFFFLFSFFFFSFIFTLFKTNSKSKTNKNILNSRISKITLCPLGMPFLHHGHYQTHK